MTPEVFTVYPSESLLLGLCLEEYCLLRRSDATISLIHRMNSRINPFMPTMSGKRIIRISEDKLPDDIEWLPIQDMRIGRRNAEPNVFYGVDERGAYKTRHYLRKHFSDLMISYLLPHLGLTDSIRPFMERFGQHNADITALAEELISVGFNDEDQFLTTGGIEGKDDKPKEIAEAVVTLMKFNNTERLFSMGQYFGRLIAAMQLYEIYHQPAFKPMFTVAEICVSLHKLIEFVEIDRSAVAKNALEGIAKVFAPEMEAFGPVWTLLERSMDGVDLNASRVAELKAALPHDEQAAIGRVFDEQRARREATLRSIKRVWPAVWVAFGEILGTIRDLDQDAKEQDAASVTPRAFGAGRDDTPDRTRQLLNHWEHELAHGPSGMGTPEMAIGGLKDSVEALTKRLWKIEFDARYKGSAGGLPSLLMDKLRLGNTMQERRFAQVALSLYKGYRNEVTHDQDGFECSVSEARYFISGVRVLLELHGEIVARTP